MRHCVRGFTLIEVLITTMIFAILVALGIPSLRVWISNTEVRAVADSLQNGLRLAQTESLRRSRQVVLSLTNATNPEAGFTAVSNGTNWAVDVIPALAGETLTLIQTGVLTSTSTGVTITAPGGGAAPAEICFNSAGRLVAQASTGVAGGTCTLPAGTPPMWIYYIARPGADHPLEVEVALGGQVRLCDPSQTLSGTNPYGC